MDEEERIKKENYAREQKIITMHREEVLTTKLESLNGELKSTDRAIAVFMSEKKVSKFPKLMKEDYSERKCKEILKFEDSSIEKRTEKFWDEYPCLKFRKYYHKYKT